MKKASGGAPAFSRDRTISAESELETMPAMTDNGGRPSGVRVVGSAPAFSSCILCYSAVKKRGRLALESDVRATITT